MNYRVRLVVGILLVIAPILALMTMNRMSIVKQLTYEREMNRLNSIGQLLADEVKEHLAQGSKDKITDLLALSSVQPYIVRISVIDPQGVIIQSSDYAREGLSPLYEDTEDITRLVDETLVKSFPLSIPRGRYNLQVLYSLAATHKDFARALHWALLFDVWLFASAALMATVASGFMEKPVRAATEAAKRIAKGDFSVSLTPTTHDAYGQLLDALNRMTGDLRDLTHDMQRRIDAATAELVEKNNRLKELDRLKSEFVAMVSHELRTPLTSIIGFARTLQRMSMSEEKQHECLAIVEKEGKHLASLIEEYLDISKMETGNLTLVPSAVDMEGVVRGVVGAFPWATNVRITLERDLPALHADGERLRRVVRNVLENAVRHGGVGVAIDLRVRRVCGVVEVSIADNGPGIPEAIQTRMFEKFYQGDTERGGSGLGLTMVKAIMEAHGGRVWCESTPGAGATFFLTLPTAS